MSTGFILNYDNLPVGSNAVSSITVGIHTLLTVILPTVTLFTVNDISKVKMSFVVRRAIVAMLQSLLFLLQDDKIIQDLRDGRAIPQGERAKRVLEDCFCKENRETGGMAISCKHSK